MMEQHFEILPQFSTFPKVYKKILKMLKKSFQISSKKYFEEHLKIPEDFESFPIDLQTLQRYLEMLEKHLKISEVSKKNTKLFQPYFKKHLEMPHQHFALFLRKENEPQYVRATQQSFLRMIISINYSH